MRWADVDLDGERVTVQVFAMRSMASGAAFHCAYLHATQQAFLEAHELAFAYFGGVFRLLRYDNLASAVRKILRLEDGDVEIATDEGNLSARYLIDASGQSTNALEVRVGYRFKDRGLLDPDADVVVRVSGIHGQHPIAS